MFGVFCKNDMCFSSYFVIEKRPLKHHHHELYSQTEKIEIIFWYCLKNSFKSQLFRYCLKVLFVYNGRFPRGVQKEEDQ